MLPYVFLEMICLVSEIMKNLLSLSLQCDACDLVSSIAGKLVLAQAKWAEKYLRSENFLDSSLTAAINDLLYKLNCCHS